ncbi:MAG: IS1595 family transposase [Bacteroidota bacterium]|nr:IS1595 family transposase [Bacteroidota bacterium]
MELQILNNFPRTNIEFQEKFNSEDACETYLFDIKWNNGFTCSKCNHDKYWKSKTGLYICKNCEHQHSLKAGTIMQKSKKSLKMWFTAIWLFTTSKQGVNAKDLERQLGVSYPTAWLWLQKLKKSSFNPERTKLVGKVEVDEFYLGGKKKGKTGRGSENKHKVAIAVEKMQFKKTGKVYVGRVRLKEVENCGAENLTKFVEDNISTDAVVKTDKWTGYNKLKAVGYDHIAKIIEDYNSEFKGLHNVVSLIKRWILGTFQGKTSQKYIQQYLEEFTFRFNRKHFNIGLKFHRLLEFATITKPLTYRDITEKLVMS